MDKKRIASGLAAATLTAATVAAVPAYCTSLVLDFRRGTDEDLHGCRHARESGRQSFADLLRADE